MSEGMATIEVTTSHMKSSPASELFHPIIEVDGEAHEGTWGFNTLDVSPGEHTLKAYHRWFVLPHAYASRTTVSVDEGQTVRLEWHTGAVTIRPGEWSVV